jgi:hypothetical protein
MLHLFKKFYLDLNLKTEIGKEEENRKKRKDLLLGHYPYLGPFTLSPRSSHVTDPPKVLGPPTDVLVLRTSDNHVDA